MREHFRITKRKLQEKSVNVSSVFQLLGSGKILEKETQQPDDFKNTGMPKIALKLIY